MSIFTIMKSNKKCSKCPYALGMIKTFVNPCPQCKENGYNMFDVFQKGMNIGKSPLIADKNEKGS